MICKAKLNKTMDSLGFREKNLGTEYIRQAVEIVDRDRAAMMCKEVYPSIAKANSWEGHRVTAANVERNIRTATAAAIASPVWDRAWREMGGWGAPTNAEVIHRLARECAIED